jgi:transcription-repair coupling factor (superfamily II helicase)
VPELDLRMALYKRAAALETEVDIYAFLAEITDRFGKPPEEVQHLLEVIKLKNLCRSAGVVKMDVGAKAIVLQFHESANLDPQKLMHYVMLNKDKVKLRPDNKLVFSKPETSLFTENKTIAEQILLTIENMA